MNRLFTREDRRTHDEWWVYFQEYTGRKLTLDELRALEALHAHYFLERIAFGLGVHPDQTPDPQADSWLERVAVGLGVHPSKTGGYLEQLRNIWDSLRKRAPGSSGPSGPSGPHTRLASAPQTPPRPLPDPGAPGDQGQEGGE